MWSFIPFGAPVLRHAFAQQPDVPLGPRDSLLIAVTLIEGPLARSRLLELLWPDAPSHDNAKNSLRQRVHRLRQQSGARLLEAGATVTRAADLRPWHLHVEAEQSHSPAGLPAPFLEATDGLTANADDWLRAIRQAWRAKRADVLSTRVDQLVMAGELEQALGHAREVLALDPLSEAAHAQLMRLHYLRGDRAAVVDAHDHCRELLRRDLGVEPSPEIRQLLVLARGSAVPTRTPRAALPVSLLRPPVLIGRERALQAMELAWSRHQTIMVAGEAGLGKSRLIHDFSSERGPAAHVRLRPEDGRVPLESLAGIVRAISSEWPQAVSDVARPQLARLHRALGQAAQADADPGHESLLRTATTDLLCHAMAGGLRCVALDDLHHCDEVTLAMLPALIHATQTKGMQWVLAYRPPAQAACPEGLRNLIEDEEEVATATVTLGPWTEQQLDQLLATLPIAALSATVTADRLFQHTGGHPLFVLETLRHMTGPADNSLALPAPASAIQTIQRRLTALSSTAMLLARLAAVAGQDFSVRLAQDVLGVTALQLADPWIELEQAWVFAGGQFVHDLMAEAVRATLAEAIKSECHAQVARALTRHEGTDPARLAEHWKQCGQWSCAADSFLSAADQALATSRRDAELSLLSQAEHCFDCAGRSADAFTAALRRVDTIRVVSGGERALVATELLLSTASTDAQRAQTLSMLALIHMSRGHGGPALTAAQECLGVLDAYPSLPEYGKLRYAVSCVAAQALVMLGRHDQGLLLLQTQRDWVLAQGELQQRLEYFNALGAALYANGPVNDAISAFDTALEFAKSVNNLAELHTMTSNGCIVRLTAGRADDALAMAREAVDITHALKGSALSSAVDRVNLGSCCVATGQFFEAVQTLEMPSADGDGRSLWDYQAQTMLAATWLRLGQRSRAIALLSPQPHDVDIPPVGQAMRTLIKLELTEQLGRVGPREVESALACARLAGHRHLVTWFSARLAAYGDAQNAALEVTELLAASRKASSPLSIALAAVELADISTSVFAPNSALTAIREALTALEAIETSLVYKPSLLWRMRAALVKLGYQQEAEDVANRAANWIVTRPLRDLPIHFRRAFLERNAVNASLRANLASVRG